MNSIKQLAVQVWNRFQKESDPELRALLAAAWECLAAAAELAEERNL